MIECEAFVNTMCVMTGIQILSVKHLLIPYVL